MDNLKCYYQTPNGLGTDVYSTCMINPQSDGATEAWSYGSSCSNANNICNSNGCPSSAQNGASCKVLLPCDSSGSCSADEGNGKWDDSEAKCVVCSSSNSENTICGDSSGIYMGPSIGSYAGTNLPCRSDYFCSKSGNNFFDSACGADAVCDEKYVGDSCGTDKICDANGRCVPYIPVPVCSASFSITSGTGDSCTVSFTVSGNCASKPFEIKEGSTSKCTGTTDASGAGSCSFTQTGSAIHTFDLWIDSENKNSQTGGGCGGEGGGGCSACNQNEKLSNT